MPRLAESEYATSVAEGDFVDPEGRIAVLDAQRHFCEAIERVAPECINDLFALLPLFDPLIPLLAEASTDDKCLETPEWQTRHRPVRQHLDAALEDWGNRWNLRADWVRRAAFTSLLNAWVRKDAGHPSPLRFSLDFFQWDWPDKYQALAVAIGGQEPTITIRIPEATIFYRPLRDNIGKLRREYLEGVAAYFEAAFADAEAQLAKGQRLPKHYYDWTARHIVLNETPYKIGDQTEKDKTGVGKAIKKTRALLGL